MDREQSASILVIEDDAETAALLGLYIEDAGYQVRIATRGEEGLQLARESQPDLVLLDLMLPGMDGWKVCKRLRQESQIPILMLTARTTETDRLHGFELGVDDYISKPFSPREVMHRIRAVLKRTRPERAARHVYGDVILDVRRRTLQVDKADVPLTTTGFEILRVLIAAPGQVFSREQLVAHFAQEFGGQMRTVDAHVGNLRRKLRNAANCTIHTVVGVGYTLKGNAQ